VNGPAADITIRAATRDDLPAIVALAQRSLGWEPGEATERHFAWKHFENPFGPSEMWVAEAGDRIVGLRTFLRWELTTDDDRILRVTRAVDTCTDAEFQRRGVFTELTSAALGAMQEQGVEFVFNTPNTQSGPANLTLGWQYVGRLPVAIRPTGLRGLTTIPRARTPATRGALPCSVGEPATDVFAAAAPLAALLHDMPTRAGLSTHRTPAFLAWRFGHAALHYRVVVAPPGVGAGAVVFHLRRRGPAVEAVICDAFAPGGDPGPLRALYRRISAEAGADYLIRIPEAGSRPGADRFLPVPRVGPVLATKEVNRVPPADRAAWNLTLGDIEGF
jgi:hypothetical protein